MADAGTGGPLAMSAHHHHQSAAAHGGTPPSHRPYWKRAHTDWRIWVAVVLMFLAIVAYLASGDLAWRPRGQSSQPVQTVPRAL